MNEALLSQMLLKDTAFQDLMQQRIYNVMLIASSYDAFMMEEDGQVEQQIYLEYMSLNLSSPPRVTRVSTTQEADQAMEAKNFDMVMAMPGLDISETFAYAKGFKERYPHVPFVVLTPFSKEVSRRLADEDFTGVDYVFSWLGNMDLLVAIVKLMEDMMNIPNDVGSVGLQLILLVEDSVRFYSSILPTLYKYILRQSRSSSTEALNAHEAMMRMRGRPKVMLARTYEEAVDIYKRYRGNVLGVISDVSFNREGNKDPQAGIRLAKYLRKRDHYLPIIIESTETANREAVQEFGGIFLDKNSKKLPVDLGKAITANFGFGDFVVRDPHTQAELMRIRNLRELQYNLPTLPDEVIFYHARRNDISRWLYSRALFPIAQIVKRHRMVEPEEVPAARQLFLDLIAKYRKMKNTGVIADFSRERFDRYSNFARIGQGSLGGKGRGLAFVDSIIKQHPLCDNMDGAQLKIPHTVVICTDMFDQFMEENELYPIALSTADDSEILQHFLTANLPQSLSDDLDAILDVFDTPLAVRSSSLLEDSHYQPFAGIYATYIIPNLKQRETMLRLISDAVKAVYASVFYAQSKAYMVATSNVIDQEKMAVIIQEVAGSEHGDYYYPSFSGVARSLNYYPVGDEVATDGVAEIAVGLGKHIVDGGLALRLSPTLPNKVLQTSTLQLALRDTQSTLYGLDLTRADHNVGLDEGFELAKIDVQQAAQTGALRYMVSTYDYANERLVDTDQGRGRKLVTFANVLRHDVFPLAKAIQFMLNEGQRQMGRPVEIEFAGNIATMPTDGNRGTVYWLQIRPMVDRKEMLDQNIGQIDQKELLLKTEHALGHGTMDNLRHLVWVDPEQFSIENNRNVVAEIERINRDFADRGQNYILAGAGRWGSSDEALGIPVLWAQISAARLIVELPAPNRFIEPSQGTHFFQNLTSFGVGYFMFASNSAQKHGFIDANFLQATPYQQVSTQIRIYTFDQPLKVMINGQTGMGVVLKPQPNNIQ